MTLFQLSPIKTIKIVLNPLKNVSKFVLGLVPFYKSIIPSESNFNLLENISNPRRVQVNRNRNKRTEKFPISEILRAILFIID